MGYGGRPDRNRVVGAWVCTDARPHHGWIPDHEIDHGPASPWSPE